MGIGHGTTNYRQRDAIFSRQRYWENPFLCIKKKGMPYTLPVSALPLNCQRWRNIYQQKMAIHHWKMRKVFAWDKETNQKLFHQI